MGSIVCLPERRNKTVRSDIYKAAIDIDKIAVLSNSRYSQDLKKISSFLKSVTGLDNQG